MAKKHPKTSNISDTSFIYGLPCRVLFIYGQPQSRGSRLTVGLLDMLTVQHKGPSRQGFCNSTTANKVRAYIFSADEPEMIINAYEEFKTILYI